MQLPVVQLVRTPILVPVYSTSMVPTGTALLNVSLLVHHRMVTHDLIFIATGLENFSMTLVSLGKLGVQVFGATALQVVTAVP